MNRSLALALIAWLAIPVAACGQAPAPAMTEPEIIATYPHDRSAFTQGLFVHEGQLFESTGQVGQSSLRRVDLASGDVRQQVNLDPPVFGEGSTRIGDEIFMLSWLSETGFVFDADSFELIRQFRYQGEGWGLTDDGSRLIMSDGSSQLRFLDPQTFEITSRLDITLNGRPVRRINELEWIDGEIWANIWETPMLVRIDPQSGAVTALVNLRALVPPASAGNRDAVANGIAWNEQTGQIYVTGKLWPVLYEIRLPASGE